MMTTEKVVGISIATAAAGALAALAGVALFSGTKNKAWKTLEGHTETVKHQMGGLMGAVATVHRGWDEAYAPNDDVRQRAEKTEKALLGAAAFVRSLR